VPKRFPPARHQKKRPTTAASDPSLLRINKVLAAAGLGSRRDVEELVLQGRVEVDGQTVTDLGTRIDPAVSKIKVDGSLLKKSRHVYYALNKPKGVLSTNQDPSGRMRVVDFVPDRQRVFSVGRLDQHSEGLILLTNDGDLAQRLAHPRYKVQKTYFVVVAGALAHEELAKLRRGVYLAEGIARIDGARIRKVRKSFTELEIVLSEGKNREIRRILARAGHKVVLLRRIAIGPLRLAELPVGAARELTQQEVKSLYACTQPAAASKSSPSKKTGTANLDSATAGYQSVANQVQPGTVSKPLELPTSDDFGLGLDQDVDLTPASLISGDDSIMFGGGEDWDDDFGGDFSGMTSSGSVLDYETDEESTTKKHARSRSPRESQSRTSQSRGRPSAKGSRTSKGRSAEASSRRATNKTASHSAGRTKASGSKSNFRSSSRSGSLEQSALGGKPRGQRPAGGKSRTGGSSSSRTGRTASSSKRRPGRKSQ
jgi:23S rRNA pseudouridine2605 synthase